MGLRWRPAALCVLVAAAASVPAAYAAHGTDSSYRGDDIEYTADPGEANRLVVEDTDSGLHLSDTGAVIDWTPGDQSRCSPADAHDVYCNEYGDAAGVGVSLGDGADTFVNHSSVSVFVRLGPGDDRAVGGGGLSGYVIQGGPGADDMRAPAAPRYPPFNDKEVVYWNSKRRVTVTADNKADDGVRGEHDNVHSDIHEVEGGRYGDTIRGFAVESGYKGNDRLEGSRHADTLDGGPGNDVLVGHGGRDTLMDDWGNNVFRARDHSVDHIWCGSGRDIVYADRRDVIEPARPGLSGRCDDVRRR